MSTRTKVWFSLSVLLVFSLLLAACATPTAQVITQEVIRTVEVEVPGEEVVVTQEVIVTVEAPTPEPVARQGAWLDRIVMVVENSAESAVTRIQAGELDVYAYSVSDPNIFTTVQNDPALTYSNAFGSYTEMTFNVATLADATKLNPFSNAKIREAMNILVDRDYIVQEIYGGLANPKFTTLNSSFPDYARYIATARKIEAAYAYNLDKVKEVLNTELTAMGASAGADGKWTFNGEPITIIVLIRTEDERKDIGDYFSNQLEAVGFTVDRQYKTRSEASPLWVQSDPTEGLWTVYTGGWITTAISRDDGSNFSFFYTKNDYPIPLFQAYTNTEEFETVALKLRNNDFASLEERDQLFPQALELAMQASERIWLVDQVSFSPMKSNIAVTYDLAGGIAGAQVWPLTARWTDQVGGSMKIAQPGLLVDPWNPVAGSNWIYDTMPSRATNDFGFVYDPYTGLAWPKRAESAEITVLEGLPVGKTLDWVTLNTAPSIEVPADAWVDWDPVNQKFITAGEKFTQTLTAKTKTVVTYPADMFQTVSWHDGSPLSVGDFVMNMITTFDYGKPESANYDPSLESTLLAFQDHFKGVRITSTDPLVIETYDDLYYLDAELIGYGSSWYPAYTYGPGAWHTVGVGNLADAAGELAFSTDKATEKEIEWMSFVAGPSLEILKKHLDLAAAEGTIPYAATMGQFVTADEAAARYTNLNRWYAEEGHFWVGTGPFFLDKVFPVEETLTLLRYESYPDDANRWAGFAAPKLATTEIEGAGTVTTGTEGVFDVWVTDPDGNPYPASEIAQVKWLLFDATGALSTIGEATPAEDGHYTITLTAEQTTALGAGSNKLEVAVVPILVSIPSLSAIEFVTAAP